MPMTMHREAEPADALAQRVRGRYVTYTGTLAWLTPGQFADVVESLGGHFTHNLEPGVSVLVVGERELLLTQDGTLLPHLRLARVMDRARTLGAAVLAEAVQRGAGVYGGDRITLVLPDNAVRNTWLRVTVKPTTNTRLARPDVFHNGNLVGIDRFTAAAILAMQDLRVTAQDVVRARQAIRLRTRFGAPVYASQFDINQDNVANAMDLAIARQNVGRTLAIMPVPMQPVFLAGDVARADRSSVTRSDRRGIWPVVSDLSSSLISLSRAKECPAVIAVSPRSARRCGRRGARRRRCRRTARRWRR